MSVCFLNKEMAIKKSELDAPFLLLWIFRFSSQVVVPTMLIYHLSNWLMLQPCNTYRTIKQLLLLLVVPSLRLVTHSLMVYSQLSMTIIKARVGRRARVLMAERCNIVFSFYSSIRLVTVLSQFEKG